MYQKVINFIKYHNAFAIGISLVLVLTLSTMASEEVRNTVIGEKIITEIGVDNSQLLSADLENFDINLKISNVLEDEENYYVDYSFNTFGVKDNLWQPLLKTERFTVNKIALGNRDLGIYLAEELGEVAQAELTYLKEAQKTERERGKTEIVETTDYTGLIGLALDLKDKILPGYEPVIKPVVVEVVQEPIVEEPVCQPSEEICDGIDNNCNGEIDEGSVCPAGESSTPSWAGQTALPAGTYCDVTHLNLCVTETDCQSAGGYWYSDICNAEPFDSAQGESQGGGEPAAEEPAAEEPAAEPFNSAQGEQPPDEQPSEPQPEPTPTPESESPVAEKANQ